MICTPKSLHHLKDSLYPQGITEKELPPHVMPRWWVLDQPQAQACGIVKLSHGLRKTDQKRRR